LDFEHASGTGFPAPDFALVALELTGTTFRSAPSAPQFGQYALNGSLLAL